MFVNGAWPSLIYLTVHPVFFINHEKYAHEPSCSRHEGPALADWWEIVRCAENATKLRWEGLKGIFVFLMC